MPVAYVTLDTDLMSSAPAERNPILRTGAVVQSNKSNAAFIWNGKPVGGPKRGAATSHADHKYVMPETQPGFEIFLPLQAFA
jgi:hypothetical protein